MNGIGICPAMRFSIEMRPAQQFDSSPPCANHFKKFSRSHETGAFVRAAATILCRETPQQRSCI
jgi:hypothetical protein